MFKLFAAIAVSTTLLSVTGAAQAQEISSPIAASASVEEASEASPTGSVAEMPELPGVSALNYARMGALADSLTTYVALHNGGVEKNALVNTSVGGLLALAAIKLGLLELADHLPPNERALAIKTSSAVWAGVSVNNLLVAVSATGAVPGLVGLGVAYLVWNQAATRLAAEAAHAHQAPRPE